MRRAMAISIFAVGIVGKSVDNTCINIVFWIVDKQHEVTHVGPNVRGHTSNIFDGFLSLISYMC
jgi:hypothetical protein